MQGSSVKAFWMSCVFPTRRRPVTTVKRAAFEARLLSRLKYDISLSLSKNLISNAPSFATAVSELCVSYIIVQGYMNVQPQENGFIHLSINFLLFRKDFRMTFSCAKRFFKPPSRRRPTALRTLIAYGQWLMDSDLPHDIVFRRAAHDNRRAAGAVGFFSIQNSFYPNKSFSGLTARRRGNCIICLFRVICGFSVFRF
jgi:hypothetical protein